VRFANAVFTYEPNFADGTYREGVVAEDKESVTFEHRSPYLIGATPPNNEPWGIYDGGGKNGLVLEGNGTTVSLSMDRGASWSKPLKLEGKADLTDLAKGHRHYWLKFHAPAEKLAAASVSWTTVCQANVAVLPRLKDGGTQITYHASGQALVSAGPGIHQSRPHLVEGDFGQRQLVLELATPRGEPVTEIFAATHVASGNPPDPQVKYGIDYSTDAGRRWEPMVRDWNIRRQGNEPADFWSQSFVWGSAKPREEAKSVRVRFSNDGGKANLRSELHLAYRVPQQDPLHVTYAWSDSEGPNRTASHRFDPSGDRQPWQIPTGNEVVTRWVEMTPE
jgi:hypothetical protein